MLKFKFKKLGIKRKVLVGCIVLAVILFFSSVISVFEFSRMNRYVSGVIADNIRSIKPCGHYRLTLSEIMAYCLPLYPDGYAAFADVFHHTYGFTAFGIHKT